jgi:hypothetical protein
MISVIIEINRTPIVSVHAVRIEGTPGELCGYEVFTTYYDEEHHTINKKILGYISHYYNNGAEVLSKKMLTLYRKRKRGTV